MKEFFSKSKIRLENLERYYFGKPIIVDTCLMLLFLEGIYDSDNIGKSKLNSNYTKEDFLKLYKFISNFKHIIITPQILAEISNLVNKRISKNLFAEYVLSFSKELLKMGEIFIGKDEILKDDDLIKLGITDISILLSSLNQDLLILSDDFKFINISISRGVPIINFNEIRFS